MKQSDNARLKIEAADLFCGAGGLSYGLRREGIQVVSGYDIDGACEWPFQQNVKAKFHKVDVAQLEAKDIENLFSSGALRVLAGCAPCQKFSNYTQKTSRRNSHRWRLLDSFARIAIELSPEVITMENVPGLSRHPRFKHFVAALKGAGYDVSWSVVECIDYGVPQRRDRLVLLASKLGRIKLLSPKEFGRKRATVRTAIGKLAAVRAGCANRQDPLHRASKLSAENALRIRVSKPGGTWRDWPKSLVLPCHRKPTGAGYPSIYGRMEWDKPAPTITTLAYNYGSGRFGHPSQARAITLREAALLQTFPKRYAFSKKGTPMNVREIGRLIGNSVPVVLGKVIGRSIIAHLRTMKACAAVSDVDV